MTADNDGDFHDLIDPVDSISATPLVGNGASPAPSELPRNVTSGLLPRGAVFGAFVGIFLGALTGGTFCWMCDDNDHLWLGVAVGVVVGLFGGAIIGGIERRRRGDLARPDVATMIGGIYGLAIAIFTFLGGMGGVRGNLSAFGLIGIAFVFPMIGILIGALFDRSYEAAQNAKRREGAIFCISAIGSCIGLIWLMIAFPNGTSAEDLIRPLKGMIYTELREQPEMRDAVVKNVVLVRKNNREYSGSFEIHAKDITMRYHVDAQLIDEILSAQWLPVDR